MVSSAIFEPAHSIIRQSRIRIFIFPTTIIVLVAFGYEAGSHYDLSIAAGELVLLPAIRKASRDALIVADGFSCREQILQQTDRKPLHTAELLKLALNKGRTNFVSTDIATTTNQNQDHGQ